MYANRTIAVIMVVFLALAYMPISAQAATSDMGMGMSKKFQRGITNALTGFLEVPAQTVKGAKKGIDKIESPQISHPAGTVMGFFRGLHHGTGRTLSGVSDSVGFWAADHMNNEGYGIPLDAEYSWEEGTQFHMLEPNLGDGLAPMGHKFVRGAGDALFSPLEFFGHVGTGIKDKNPGAGILQGMYFSASRLYTGGSDAVLCTLPNPKDTVGNQFDYAYPWGALKGEEKMTMEAKPANPEQ
ncbi:MAG: hypothetical protein HZC17_02745 [Candidatus Omnitrophica bacterium]|nr:hypothetical protein [Candidatus Omnitrophota bacterium]